MRDKVKRARDALPDLPEVESRPGRGRRRCAVRVAAASIPRSRTRGRPRICAAIRRRRVCLDLQLPLHHLRARAAARADRDQAQRPPRAVRPRQARCARSQIALRKRPVEPETHRADWCPKIVRELESLGESEIVVGGDRRDGDGASARTRRRRLCALRLGLPQFPRGQGLRGRARRTRGRQGRRPAEMRIGLPGGVRLTEAAADQCSGAGPGLLPRCILTDDAASCSLR